MLDQRLLTFRHDSAYLKCPKSCLKQAGMTLVVSLLTSGAGLEWDPDSALVSYN